MLKVDLDAKKGSATIVAKGSGFEILADLTFLVRQIYREMDEDEAKAFKYAIQEVIADEGSPVWEREKKLENEPDGVKRIRFVFPGEQE